VSGRGRLFLLFLGWPVALVTPTGPSMSDSVLLAAIRLVDDRTWTLSDERDPKVVFLTEAFDISVHGQRIYSGVGPGASVVAAPFYLALKPVLACFDGRIIENRRLLNYYVPNRRAMDRPVPGRLKDVYLLQVFLAWIVVALVLASFLFRLHGRLTDYGLAEAHANAIMLAVGIGSMALYYSSMYSRQALAYGLAWHAVLSLMGSRDQPAPSPLSALGAGTLLGAAIAIDYAAAILVALSLLFLLPRLPAAARLLTLTALGVMLGLLALYHEHAFGSPWATPYHFRFWFTAEPLARQGIDLAAFQQGPALGMNGPSLAVMLRLCFGTFKGLFVYSPLLLAGLLGHLAGLRDPRCRTFHVYCLLVFLCTLTFNSTLGTHVPEYGRHFWGGLSVLWGPRYLYGVVPFLAVGLVRLDWRRRATRILCGGLLLVGCVFNLLGAMFSDVVMSTSAFGPELRSPLAYVMRLLLLRGPRVPMLDVYGVAPAAQWAVLLALAAASALMLGQGGVASPSSRYTAHGPAA